MCNFSNAALLQLIHFRFKGSTYSPKPQTTQYSLLLFVKCMHCCIWYSLTEVFWLRISFNMAFTVTLIMYHDSILLIFLSHLTIFGAHIHYILPGTLTAPRASMSTSFWVRTVCNKQVLDVIISSPNGSF